MAKPPIWRVKFYGTRGSIPVPDPECQEFGGNTFCIAIDKIKGSGRILGIVDAGTGIRKLGKEISSGIMPRPEHIIIAFTHFHWDHIQGFPFFEPAYNPDQKITLVALGRGRGLTDLEQIFRVQMQQEYFPVQLEEMGAQFEFLTLDAETDNMGLRTVDKISAMPLNHPGGAYAYRFEAQGASIVIATDTEHGDSINPQFIEFCRDVDLLIHDAQYTNEELLEHRGWGHSSFDQALEIAERAKVGELILTHHDPDHDDTFLQRVEIRCRERFAACTLAREGMVVEV